ncbi:MAG TPA: bifunctional 5,10-methylenetetrahydrofolate dehydrogenase/5,10-methenyltetrahydrofolate cyclohydrolase [Candidatus Paceibacterota bacterium]|nr:bifunctional 5,10-methylenetetrahydrofolate dehydrogenase/5,10-methenyltetrahydrofolate cyclohydrolase [Candidatus Paceibacterota bacterium]HMP18947.1 bifunctional 5,10-methylenetetrahydrofolate dehydrogenase/5,10-methenyltetrahydrofolate cyclohydrolase [Candidatus Paceibacterota bacterium]HMP85440.1 bifunctional 5,10-methylenetetrahydrofolate dehydrogenase/5,10-methenyltetrahydrofolate cyclohydrolase [Candidatus Paceibacterota bacterium]
MQILDGKKISQKFAQQMSEQIFDLKIKPKLVIFQVGDIESSNIYISRKKKFAEKIGAIVDVKKFDFDISQEKIISEIYIENKNKDTHGIIVQLPLPENLDKNLIIDSIDSQKDVDGITSTNISKLFRNQEDFIIPATTRGIFELLNEYNIEFISKKIVVIGRSNLVGKPTAIFFSNKGATVKVCHSKTTDLSKEITWADIVISATGQIDLINHKMISQNQVIIDVGISYDKNKRICGDVNTEKVIVKAISPVPGGVGPMTVCCLFKNLFEVYQKQLYNH